MSMPHSSAESSPYATGHLREVGAIAFQVEIVVERIQRRAKSSLPVSLSELDLISERLKAMRERVRDLRDRVANQTLEVNA